jgi:hypothetical protein
VNHPFWRERLWQNPIFAIWADFCIWYVKIIGTNLGRGLHTDASSSIAIFRRQSTPCRPCHPVNLCIGTVDGADKIPNPESSPCIRGLVQQEFLRRLRAAKTLIRFK